MIRLKANGVLRTVDADPGTPLIGVLRDHLGLEDVTLGCGVGVCGACTVHVDGTAMRACVLPIEVVEHAEIVTVKGLAASAGLPAREMHPLQRAWLDVKVPQCGHCEPGMLMAVAALLRKTQRPTDADIDAAIANVCRCGTDPQVRRAVRSAVCIAGWFATARSSGAARTQCARIPPARG